MRRIANTALVALLLGLLVVPLLGASVVSAASGEVIWVNPPENKGRIRNDDDGKNYEYNVNAGRTNPPGYEPALNERVTFTEGPGNTASDVTSDPAGVPGDPPCEDPDPAVCPP